MKQNSSCWKSATSLFLFVFILTLSLTVPASPQGATGIIVGSVTDSSGAAAPGAAVIVRNKATDVERRTITGSTGEYVVALLPPGDYAVRIQKEGFQEEVFENTRLKVDDVVRRNAIIRVGVVTQQVLVTTAEPLVQSDTSKVGFVIDKLDSHQLPLNERNFIAFALLGPGAQMPTDGSESATTGALSVNGAREQANNFLLDGGDNNDPFVNQYSTLPPFSAIEEFKVQTSNSSAAFGRTGGAQINVVLRSGSNNFHGTAFGYFRNRNLDASNFFDRPGVKPRLDRSQAGGSIGGPIQRNRTFFFGAYESFHLREGRTQLATVPSQNQRVVALNAVPASQRNPAGLAVFNLYPAANVGANLAASNSFLSSPILHRNSNQAVLKLDHNPNAVNSFSGHYVISDEDRYEPFNRKWTFTNLPGYGSNSEQRGQNATISWTRILSSHTINDARVGFSRRHTTDLHESSGTSKSSQLGFPDISSKAANWGYPNISLPGFDGIGEPIVMPQNFLPNTFQFADSMSFTPTLAGRLHEIKFGVDVRRIRLNFFLNALSRGEWFFLGAFTGDPLQDLLRGLPTLAIAPAGDTDSSLRSTALNLYLHDNIHMSSRLSLDLGVRYEFNSPPVEAQNRLSVPDLSPNSLTCTPKPNCQFIIAGTNGIPRATYSSDFNNVAPRVGFSWRPTKSDGFVLRSAYGVFYDASILNLNILPRSNPPFFNVGVFANNGLSTIQSIVDPARSVPIPPQIVMISPDYRDAYIQQWHFTVQSQARSNLMLEAAYVGAKGSHLLRLREGNQPSSGGLPPFPQFGAMRRIEDSASSTYHSLQVKAERRLSSGFSLLSGYTWSKSLDDTSNLFGTAVEPGIPQNSKDLSSERSVSNFDTRHRLVISGVFQPQWRSANRALNAVIGNWRAEAIGTWQSGRPFTVNRGIDQSLTGVDIGASDRPDQIADPFVAGAVANHPDPACRKTISQGGRAADVVRDPSSWFNPCAFAAPSLPRFGSAGRNSVTGQPLANIDLSLSKEFPLNSESGRLEVRFEFFNLLNHPNFDVPDRIFDSPTFGAMRSANAYGNKPPRQVQLGLRFAF